jgi:lysophospholipase L1-like esterase
VIPGGRGLLPPLGLSDGGERVLRHAHSRSLCPSILPPGTLTPRRFLGYSERALKAHATGITLVLTVAFAVGLSIAPIRDVFRPFPALATESPVAVLARVLLPPRADVHAQDAITGAPDAPAVDAELPEEQPPADGRSRDREEDLLAAGAPTGNARLYAGLPSFEVRGARALDRWAERVGARHLAIEEGCRRVDAYGTCVRRALDDFFDRLEPLRRGDGMFPVRIVHLGDSQIASDHIADLVRRRLQFRYGSSGRGFLFVDRPTRVSGRKVRTGEASEGWQIASITDRELPGLVGFTGVRFTSRGSRQNTRFEVDRSRFAEVAFLTARNGGTLEISADGQTLSSLLTRYDEPALAFSRVRIPAGSKALTLQVEGGEISVLGATLESGAPGVVYDTVGLPGAMFKVFLRAPESAFASQLARRHPALVILMLGGNEAYEIGRGWQKLDGVRRDAKALIQRIRVATPAASCLLLSPMDAGLRTVSGTIAARPHTQEVGRVIREVALEAGCAFWDIFAAMGGERSVARWYEQELFHPDLIHPKGRGADLLGHLFEVALENARQARPGMQVERIDSGEIEGASGSALAHLFERLRAQEATTIVQVADSPWSTDAFSSTVRARLANALQPSARAPRLDSLAPPESGALGDDARKHEWAEALRARGASLLVLAPAAPEDALEVDAGALRAEQSAVLSAMRSAVPDASCLVVGPADRVYLLPGQGAIPAQSTDVATRVLRELAAAQGCAFWSARGAMGGRGAMRRWQSLDPALADSSGARLTRAGLVALGDAFADELVAAWRAWVASGEARAEAGAAPAGGTP